MILALVLLILLIVLLVPIRMDVKVRYDEDVKARGHVTWLLRALNAKIEWMADHGLLRVKLLGLKTVMKKHLGDWGPQPAETAAKADTESAAKPGDDEVAEISVDETAEEAGGKPEEPKPGPEAAKPAEKEEKPDKAGSEAAEEKPAAEASKEEAAEAEPEAGSEPEEELPKLDAIAKKLEEIEEKLDEFQGYWYDEKNRKTVRRIGRQLKRIGKHLKPTRFQVEGELGFDDPGKTGKIMGYIYSLYPILGEHVRIEGNYEEAVMKFRGEVKCRIRLGLFISVAVRLLLDGNLRKWIKKLMKKDKKKDSKKTKETPAETADQEQKAA